MFEGREMSEDVGDYADVEDQGSEDGDSPHKSVGQSIQGACCLCVLGFLMFPGALYLLGWNENRAVCTSRAILAAEAEARVGKCVGSYEDMEESLIFYNCPVDEDSIQKAHLSDFAGLADFTDVKFTEKRPVCYSQTATMYQCVESVHTSTETHHGKTKTKRHYSYNAEFHGSVVESGNFHYSSSSKDKMRAACGSDFTHNPGASEWHSVKPGVETRHAGTAKSGIYTLSDHQLSTVPCTTVANVKPWSKPSFSESSTQPPPSGVTRSTAHVVGGSLETCDPSKVRTGCMRMEYHAGHITHAVVLGKLRADGRTEGWEAPETWLCSAITVSEFHFGSDSASWTFTELIAHMHSSNSFTTWLLRAVGLLTAWFGVYLVFAPIKMLAEGADALLSYIPCVGEFLGDVVNGVVTCMLISIAFALSVPIGLMVIAIVWVVMRPLVGIPLFIVALLLFGWGMYNAHKAAKHGKSKKGKKKQGSGDVEMSDQHSSSGSDSD